jgi:capsular polysaccharide biosynthesis protein
MPIMKQTTNVYGGAEIILTPPDNSLHENAIFAPNSHEWGGLYDSSGTLIKNAGMHRGPDRHLVLPRANIKIFPKSTNRLEGEFLYIGPIHPHFGHFLLSTFSRFWSIAKSGLNGRKILYDSAKPVEALYTNSYFQVIMSGLGITPEDFQYQAQPCWIDNVLVPEPSFTEQLSAHSEFKRLAEKISINSLKDKYYTPRDAIVYLSKAKLSSGVWRFENEIRIEEEMVKRGAVPIHPETLPFDQQISIFNGNNTIIGSMGSAIHTSAFSLSPLKMAILCREDQIISNFTLIDKLSDNTSNYFYSGTTTNAGGEGFQLNLEIESPSKVSAALIEQALSMKAA